ncbi:MAG: hypothetical protein DI535_00615 [Citrobacter freundii]|nr:MAG: hypothetical protein DI535_00615 [Citrobacter freundii]
MRVHLIRKETVLNYATRHAASRIPFDEWLVKLKYADWCDPADILRTFASADRHTFNLYSPL